MFVDGGCHKCAAEVAAFPERLCAAGRIALDPAVSDRALALIVALYRVAFAEAD